MFVQSLSLEERKAVCMRTLKAFVLWCRQEFDVDLYDYEIRIAEAVLSAILVEPMDVAIAMARQSGKTETVTLLLRFLLIFYRFLLGSPLMCGLASPKGEQAKTSLDRIKLSIPKLGERWQVEDREFNAATVRAYRHNQLFGEIFKFSLAPTTSNESKTINVLIVDEAHLADDVKRSNELDPMLSSTNGITIFIGVGCTRICDFLKAKAGERAGTVAIVVPVDEVIRDRRKKFEQTGDPKHLNYEHAFERELRKKGKENPEVRRNYYLEDTVEEGNFVSRERLLSCARGPDVIVPVDKLYAGIDWARVSDFTWVTVVNDKNDVIDWLKVPHVTYLEQVQVIREWAERKREGRRKLPDGTVETFEYTYKARILAVRGDATGGAGDAPNEMLMQHGGLPVDEESFFKFSMSSKNDLYVNWEQAIYKDPGDPGRFSYPADHPLTSEFEEQTTRLLREYKGDGEYLSVHHPDEPDAKDDAPDSTALASYAAVQGFVGELLFA